MVHNEDDGTVPIERAYASIAAVEAVGGTVNTTINPTGGHGVNYNAIWNEAASVLSGSCAWRGPSRVPA